MSSLTPQVTEYLSSIGRLGGKVGGKAKTPKKAAAARLNGKLGGRPRKHILEEVKPTKRRRKAKSRRSSAARSKAKPGSPVAG